MELQFRFNFEILPPRAKKFLSDFLTFYEKVILKRIGICLLKIPSKISSQESRILSPKMHTDYRFLEPPEYPKYHVALVSYPRSGNSLLRRLLEQVTGIHTGSDTRPDRTLSRALKTMGMEGEGVVDGRVLIVKSHYPERHGYLRFKADKILLLTRNPFDAVDSYFNLGMTNTHTESLDEINYTWLSEVWEQLVPNEFEAWSTFHEYWRNRQIPMLSLRFEDLLLHTKEILRRVVSFVFDIAYEDVPSSRFWEKIQDAVTQQSGPYQPRSGRLGNSLRHYRKEQLDLLVSKHQRLLRAYGYDPVSQGFPNTITSLPTFKRCLRDGDKGMFMTINKGRSTRLPDDIFGRNITKVRKCFTDNDTVPFPRKMKTDQREGNSNNWNSEKDCAPHSNGSFSNADHPVVRLENKKKVLDEVRIFVKSLNAPSSMKTEQAINLSKC